MTYRVEWRSLCTVSEDWWLMNGGFENRSRDYALGAARMAAFLEPSCAIYSYRVVCEETDEVVAEMTDSAP